MIHLESAVIVEGKYDKIKLSNFLDAEIIVTDGFRIFKNTEKKALIRRIAEKKGVIIMTDSDSAGFMIRGHLTSFIPNDKIINVFVPQIDGKEKRKTSHSAQGYLGVEGLSEEVLTEALRRAGIDTDKKIKEVNEKITPSDLYFLGLSGKDDSKQKRETLQRHLNLPIGMSTSQLLTALNSLYTRDEFFALLNERQEK
jgi:ribonuclease M5